jgi:type I restriction enzyme S subunit
MKLKTFFEKFDLFADAPDAVAKMRELVLDWAATGKLCHDVSVEWRDGVLGDVIELISGQHLLAHEHNAEGRGIPYLTGPSDFGESSPIPTRWTDQPKVLAQPGDILITVKGSGVGKTNVLVDQPTAISRQLMAIRVTGADPEFVNVVLKRAAEYFQNAKSGIAIPGIGRREVLGLAVVLPPLAEQKRIVAKVDELMALCDRLEAQQQERETRHAALARASLACFADAPTPANLNLLFHSSFPISPSDLRKSILTLAVQGKLVPQDPNDEPAEELLARLARELTPERCRKQASPLASLPADSLQYNLPDSWTWARFCDAAIIASNLVKPDDFLDFTHLAPDNIEKGNGVLLTCRTVREDKVISSNHRFYPGQIVYSKIRPNLAKVVVVDFEGLCSADMYPIDALINVFYLQFYMLSESFLVQAVKTDTRVAMPKINQSELNAIAVPIPPLAEQRRIVAKVSELMALVDELETQLAASRAAAEKLLSALVTELTGTTSRLPAHS